LMEVPRFQSNGDLTALPGSTAWYFSVRSGGAWTDYNDHRPIAEIEVVEMNAAGGQKAYPFAQ